MLARLCEYPLKYVLNIIMQEYSGKEKLGIFLQIFLSEGRKRYFCKKKSAFLDQKDFFGGQDRPLASPNGI